MERRTYELMQDQVYAIFRTLTGAEMPPLDVESASPAGPDTVELITRRFSELDALVRLIPAVSQRLPPFAFAPPIDLVETEKDLTIEVALPGVTRDELQVELTGRLLLISGTRVGDKVANGRVYRHAEIPRGPFRRVVSLPFEVAGQPRFELDGGIARIHLAKLPMPTVAKA